LLKSKNKGLRSKQFALITVDSVELYEGILHWYPLKTGQRLNVQPFMESNILINYRTQIWEKQVFLTILKEYGDLNEVFRLATLAISTFGRVSFSKNKSSDDSKAFLIYTFNSKQSADLCINTKFIKINNFIISVQRHNYFQGNEQKAQDEQGRKASGSNDTTGNTKKLTVEKNIDWLGNLIEKDIRVGQLLFGDDHSNFPSKNSNLINRANERNLVYRIAGSPVSQIELDFKESNYQEGVRI